MEVGRRWNGTALPLRARVSGLQRGSASKEQLSQLPAGIVYLKKTKFCMLQMVKKMLKWSNFFQEYYHNFHRTMFTKKFIIKFSLKNVHNKNSHKMLRNKLHLKKFHKK